MKRIILLSLLSFGIAGFAFAQTTTLSSSHAHKAKAHMIRGTGAKHKKPTHFSQVKTNALSNRKIYNWSNGQRSTPTGEEAAPVNGEQYLSLKKGTDAKPQPKKTKKNN